jgi:hypothetical protein
VKHLQQKGEAYICNFQRQPMAFTHWLQSVSEWCHLPRKAYRHQHHAGVWVCRERPGAARHRKGE